MSEQPGRGQPFIAIPGVVAVIDSVVAGAMAAIDGIGLGVGTWGALTLGCTFFLLSLACFAAWAWRQIASYRMRGDTLFPTPADSAAT